jgi:hypothetical protein
MFTPDGKKPAINSPQTRETLEWLVNLNVKQQVSPSKDELAQESADTRFLNGRLAMVPYGSWQIKDLNLKAKQFKWDLVPFPLATRTGKNGSTNQMASIAMSPQTKQKDGDRHGKLLAAPWARAVGPGGAPAFVPLQRPPVPQRSAQAGAGGRPPERHRSSPCAPGATSTPPGATRGRLRSRLRQRRHVQRELAGV